MSSTSSSYTPRPSRVRSPPGPAPPIPPITPASLDAGINRLPPPPPRPITRGRGGGGGYRDETPANQIKDLLPPIRPRPPKLPAWSGSEERLWQEFLAEGPPNQPKYWKEAMAGWDFDENGVPIDPSTTDSTTALIPPTQEDQNSDGASENSTKTVRIILVVIVFLVVFIITLLILLYVAKVI